MANRVTAYVLAALGVPDLKRNDATFGFLQTLESDE